MRKKHFEKFLGERFTLEPAEFSSDGQRVKEGWLVSKADGQRYPIRGYIPRFVPESNYSDNFGLQWNRFKSTQLDSRNMKDLSSERFWSCTKWRPEDLRGKIVLEAGSGAGRFTEILLSAGAEVVSMDYSNAVDANLASHDNERLFLFQGDIYSLPLEKARFDFVFCYGVLQHTPDAEKAFRTLLDFIKPGGRFSMDHYEKLRKPSVWSTPKYFWRPVTSKMSPRTLLKIIEFYIPLWLPFDTLIKKIPYFGRRVAALIPIPCWNYLDWGLSYKQRREWAIMDTFDALAPAYDTPRTLEEIREWCDPAVIEDVDLFIGGNGVVVNGRRRSVA